LRAENTSFFLTLPAKHGTMKNLTTGQYINIALILLVLVFIGQNLQTVEVNFLFFHPSLPLIIVILGCLLFGYVTALIMRRNKKQDQE
jgi:uncharacterized integral membrane protein